VLLTSCIIVTVNSSSNFIIHHYDKKKCIFSWEKVLLLHQQEAMPVIQTSDGLSPNFPSVSLSLLSPLLQLLFTNFIVLISLPPYSLTASYPVLCSTFHSFQWSCPHKWQLLCICSLTSFPRIQKQLLHSCKTKSLWKASLKDQVCMARLFETCTRTSQKGLINREKSKRIALQQCVKNSGQNSSATAAIDWI